MSDIAWQSLQILKSDRARIKGQKPFVLWLTGLSGSGKSTLANALDAYLFNQGFHTYLLDGDNVRHGLNKDLGFDDKSRVENIRRIGEVAKLMVDAGIIVITAFISPFRADRQMVKELFEKGEFIEVFLDTPLSICEQRDPKGLYKKARAGEIDKFTGIDSPYESPLEPEILLESGNLSVESELSQVLRYLRDNGFIHSSV